VDRYDGFTQFVGARGASMSRTAYLLTGDDVDAANLLRAALVTAARQWRRVFGAGNPEAFVRDLLARSYARRHGCDDLGLSRRQRAIAVLSGYHGYSAAEVGTALECSEASVRGDLRSVAQGYLVTLAGHAGDYADSRAAIAAADRARRRLALVPVVLVVVLGGGAVSAVIAPHGHHVAKSGPLPDSRPGVELRLPAQVAEPQSSVPLLPGGHAVGRGLIAYRACPHTCTAYLMLADGTQYRLALPTGDPACCPNRTAAERDLPVSISPDGRWLAIADGGEVRLRDLTSSVVRRAAVTDIIAWSPNGRFILGDCPNGVCRVEVDTDASTPMDPRARGVDNTGRVIIAFSSIAVSSINVQITDPDATAAITGGQLLHGTEAFAIPGSDAAAVRVAFGDQGWYAAIAFEARNRRPSALVLGNFTDGSVAGRADLPAGAGQPFFFGLEATLPVQAAPADPVVLFGVAPGGLVARSKLPARAEFAVAGQGWSTAGPAVISAR
jgi:DNA-binding CsgD family transcriptional regulator